jgi:hypothetical protein
MEFVILPPNTSPNVIRNTHTLIDTRMNRQDFQNKVHEIMSIPNKGHDTTQSTSKHNIGRQSKQSDNNNIQRLLEISNKVSKFTKEAEKLMTLLCVFCNCRNVENRIQKYYNKSMLSGRRMKRQRLSTSIMQNSYAIPIQLLGLQEQTESCKISVSSVTSSMFFSSILYQESMILPDSLLELIMKNIDMKQLKIVRAEL